MLFRSWFNHAWSLCSASRHDYPSPVRYSYLGFRLLSSALGAEPNERATSPEAEPGVERASSAQIRVKDKEPIRDPRESAFWKIGKKPDWVSAFGSDDFGLWCEFQVPNRWSDKKAKSKERDGNAPSGFVTQRMRWIKPGTFTMGSHASTKELWWGDETQHEVTLTRGFWMADTPCTQGLWVGMGNGENPSRFQWGSNPVENVSWRDCQAWLERLGAYHQIGRAHV